MLEVPRPPVSKAKAPRSTTVPAQPAPTAVQQTTSANGTGAKKTATQPARAANVNPASQAGAKPSRKQKKAAAAAAPSTPAPSPLPQRSDLAELLANLHLGGDSAPSPNNDSSPNDNSGPHLPTFPPAAAKSRTERAREQRARLQVLNAALTEWREQQGGSKKAFKQQVKGQHICLSEGLRMTSASQLQKHLQKHPGCMVGREIAKEFEFVKMCLTHSGPPPKAT